jgi:3D (Asp-Asp-Asp) domain-containing protein
LIVLGAAGLVLGGAFATVRMTGSNPPTAPADVASSALVALPQPVAPEQPPAVPVRKVTTQPAAEPKSDEKSKDEKAKDEKAKDEKAKDEKAHAKSTSKKTSGASASKLTAGRKMTIDLTGYSWFDNTPAGSSEVANPILHKEAGGAGTYSDPITVAVADGSFKPGTRFYIAKVKRYVIVEDSGASDGNNHLDMWIGGKGGSKSAVSKCMDKITGKTTAEVNPPKGRPVMSGPIYSGGCRVPGTS